VDRGRERKEDRTRTQAGIVVRAGQERRDGGRGGERRERAEKEPCRLQGEEVREGGDVGEGPESRGRSAERGGDTKDPLPPPAVLTWSRGVNKGKKTRARRQEEGGQREKVWVGRCKSTYACSLLPLVAAAAARRLTKGGGEVAMPRGVTAGGFAAGGPRFLPAADAERYERLFEQHCTDTGFITGAVRRPVLLQLRTRRLTSSWSALRASCH